MKRAVSTFDNSPLIKYIAYFTIAQSICNYRILNIKVLNIDMWVRRKCFCDSGIRNVAMGLFVLLSALSWVLLLFLVSLVYVRADYFWPNGDILYCEFIPILAMGIKEIPEVTDIFYYERNNIQGSYIQDLFLLRGTDLVNVYKGQVKRYPEHISLSVPPGSKVSFLLFAINFSGHNVYVNKILIPIKAQSNHHGICQLVDMGYDGSIKKNLPIRFNNRDLFYNTDFWEITKGLNIPNTGIVNANYKTVIKTVKVIQPVTFEESFYKLSWDRVEKVWYIQINVCMKNKASFEVHGQLCLSEQCIDIKVPARSVKCHTFLEKASPSFDKDKTYTIKFLDYGLYKACLARSDFRGDSLDMSTRGIFVSRNDKYHNNWFAWQPDFAVVSGEETPVYCIEILPYTLNSTVVVHEPVNILTPRTVCNKKQGNRIVVKTILQNVGPTLYNQSFKYKWFAVNADKKIRLYEHVYHIGEISAFGEAELNGYLQKELDTGQFKIFNVILETQKGNQVDTCRVLNGSRVDFEPYHLNAWCGQDGYLYVRSNQECYIESKQSPVDLLACNKHGLCKWQCKDSNTLVLQNECSEFISNVIQTKPRFIVDWSREEHLVLK